MPFKGAKGYILVRLGFFRTLDIDGGMKAIICLRNCDTDADNSAFVAVCLEYS